MRSPSGLHLHYLSLAKAPARWSNVLGGAVFGSSSTPAAVEDAPLAWVRTPLLMQAASCELWSVADPVHAGRRSRLRYRATHEVLFGCLTLPEGELSAVAEAQGCSALQQATVEAYDEMLATVDSAGYPYVVRVWNYLADINRPTHGIERYRQFNTGRQIAFARQGRAVAGGVPAACALGTPPGSPLVLYFLASKSPPTFVENPRQMSAYHYPAEYGAQSPVFSRAAVLHAAAGPTLFISGTASILGHRTVHAGDVAAQTRETLTNIEAVVREANRRVLRPAHDPFTLAELAYKVYVRHPADLPRVRHELSCVLEPDTHVLYLHADICRADLLVEIEATGQPALAGVTPS